MSIRKLILLILTAIVIVSGDEASADPQRIRIHDSSHAVDIDDIIETDYDSLSEIDIKRICADITGRYHELGYTAFYIKKAELNKDGTADLFFIEAVVADIAVIGASSRKEEIALSVFNKGELFNEFTLKRNIADAKKKFSLKRLNVDISRNDEKNVFLSVHAIEKNNEIETAIVNSPIYGVIPELKYRINYGGFIAGASFSSSFSQKAREYSSGSFYINSGSIPASPGFIFRADYADRKNSYTAEDELFYSHKAVTSKGGYCFNNGAASMTLFLSGTADVLDDYPDEKGGVSFSGLQMSLGYDNSYYKIDYSDKASAAIDVFSGWNFIEERVSVKAAFDYFYNIPLEYGFFISINGNSLYISDKERFSRFYVYDRYLPCRDSDYSTASWRNVAGADIAYEVMSMHLFVMPGLKWGVHNSGDVTNNVCAAEFKIMFNSEVARIDVSYSYDVKQSIVDGFFMFSAAAVY